MMKAQHTPGPWVITRWGTNHIIIKTQKKHGYIGDPQDKSCVEICDLEEVHYYIDGGTRYKNARLITAAPDLLEALRMVRDADEDCKKDGFPTIPEIARAKIDRAIAKAEGK